MDNLLPVVVGGLIAAAAGAGAQLLAGWQRGREARHERLHRFRLAAIEAVVSARLAVQKGSPIGITMIGKEGAKERLANFKDAEATARAELSRVRMGAPSRDGAAVASAAGQASSTIQDLGSALFQTVVSLYETGRDAGPGLAEAGDTHRDAEAAVDALADEVARLMV